MSSFAREIETIRAFLVARGYKPGECVNHFLRGIDNSTLVAHFTDEAIAPYWKNENEIVAVSDSTGPICAMLDLQTGKITIPEML